MTPYIGMVAGEPSGDLLAARVLQGLANLTADLNCSGIGGPHMAAQGFNQWHPMEALSVFGYVDALRRLPQLISTYRNVKKRWLSSRPDVFVGIDAPDFNLRLEAQLRAAKIPTVHFVGPSIWAWRYDRINKIREAVSHMLVLFPFETEIYEREGVPVTYVGHPLASVIPKQPDMQAARQRLNLPEGLKVLALMPGSRASEIKLLTPRFLAAVKILQQQDPDLHVLVPMVSEQRSIEFNQLLMANPIKNCHLIIANKSINQQQPVAWDAMQAADAILVASGTATLEAALFKKPMVISYVLSPAMRRIMAFKSGQKAPLLPWVGLPNILCKDFIVPELLQDNATAENLALETWKALTDTAYRHNLMQHYNDLHNSLDRDTASIAAQVILDQIK